MVGVAILKDFETGSYRRMRLTFYDGTSFDDIDKAENYISCTANPEEKSIIYDFDGDVKRPTASEVFEICRKVREMWMENEYITIVRFTLNHGEIKTRLVSEKLGVNGFPDRHALFDTLRTEVYKLAGVIKDGDILYISSLCEALNMALESLFGITYPLYYYSSGGIYINVFLAEVIEGEKQVIPNELRACRYPMKKYYRLLKRKGNNLTLTDYRSENNGGTFSQFIASYREYKCKIGEYVSENPPKTYSELENLPFDEKIKALTARFCDIAYEFADGLRGYFIADSHVRYMTVNDLLEFMCVPSCREHIVKKARAASINYKFHMELPYPDYYDSRGRAYRQRG